MANSENLNKSEINRWLNKNLVVHKQQFIKARIGNIKDEYAFEKNVGHGGFGVVYRAKHRGTMKRVAIEAIQK